MLTLNLALLLPGLVTSGKYSRFPGLRFFICDAKVIIAYLTNYCKDSMSSTYESLSTVLAHT